MILNDIELDFGADHEKTENLEEHVTSKYSPWHLDYSWSKEAKKLRELAVKSPWLIDDNFILSFFKTLRICDKNVSKTLLAAIMKPSVIFFFGGKREMATLLQLNPMLYHFVT